MERQGDSRRGKDGDTLPGAPAEDIPNEASEATRNLLRTIDCPDGSACTTFRCLFSHETRAENQEPDLFNSRYNSAQNQTTRKLSNNVVRSVSPSSPLSPDVSEAPSRAQGPTGTPKDISTSLLSSKDRNHGLVNPAANDLSTPGKEHVNIDNKFLQKVLNTGSAVSPRASPKTSRIVLPPISRLLEKQAEGREPKIQLDPNVSNDGDNNLGTPVIPPPLPPPRWLGPSNMPRYPSVLSMPHSLPRPTIYDLELQSQVHEHGSSGEPRPQSSHHPVEDQASRNQTEASSRPADHQATSDFPVPLPDPRFRKYQCTQCDKSFRLAKDLDRHYKSIHATDTELYRCRCNYSSYRKDQMKVHIKSRKCLPASSNDVHTCVCKTFETPSVDEYLDHIENCGKKRVGRPKKRGSPERDEGHGNHKSNIAFEDGFGLHHDRYQFQSPAGDIDTLKKNFDYNMIQKDGTPLSRVAQQPAELLPLVFTSPASLPFLPRPLSPGSNISGSLEAKDRGELQDNWRPNRCMLCKQKQDRDTDADSARFLSCRKCGEHAHYQCAANAPYTSDTGNPGDRDIIISSNFDMESDVGFLNMFPEPEISPTNWTCPNCVEDASDSSENEKRSLENSASPEPSTNKEEHTIHTIMPKELKEGSDTGKATVSDMGPPKDNPFIQPTVNNLLNKNAGHKDAHQLQKPASSTGRAFWRDSIKKIDSIFNGFTTSLAFDRAAFDSVGAGQARHGDLARAVESATDSGYGSQPPIGSRKSLIEYHAVDARYETDASFDDTATEYSDTSSVATWKKESYIEEFVDDLLARVREFQLDEETLDRISALLPDLLKAFALRVGYNAPSRMHRDVMYFIHKHRGMISSNFKEKSLHRGEDTSDGTMLPGESDRIPLQDLMKSWFSSLSNVEIRPENELWDPILRSDDSDLESQASTPTDASQDVTEGDNDAWLRSYRDFIRNSEVFQWLLGRLYVESSLVATEPRAMEAIRAKIISSLRPSQRISRNASSECFNASFCVGWDPFRFFQSQEYDLKAAEVASRIITLTGSENDAQALTCSQYLSQTWPTTGSLTLKVIKGVLQNRPNHMQNCTYPDGTTVIARLHDSIFTAHVTGVADSIAEIGEQIAWILASLRTSNLSNGLLYCTPVIARVNENGPRFQDLQSKFRPTVTFDIEILSEEVPRPVKPEDGQCWHNMFLNPVVVKGYPIRRKAEKNSGVEMTLDIMAGLARANVVDEFNGMTFIKGFSTMLVPTQKVKETILWHLVYNEDGTRISFNDHNMPHIERVSALELTNFRHVVGWCSEARFFPGSSQCNYTIGASGLPKPHQGCALANLFVSPGRCIVSNALYSLGQKDTPVHVARNGYIPKLQWLSTKLVLLWDEQDKRGWLINGTSALLYLVRSSLEHNSRDKFRSAFIFKKEDLKESPNPYTADSANDVLINEENCALKLYKENNHFLLLQGRIEHYFNILEKLIDHQSDISQDGEVNMENRTRGDLEGWDFKDLATNRDPLYPRIAHLEASGKAWVDFARAAQVITLFGKGFGELIKPAGSDICAYWSELPKQNYYIAACLSDLDLWVENNDHYNDDQVRLTEKIIWHTPSPCLFGSCRCVGSLGPDHCEPVQTLVPVSLSHILLPRKVQIPSQGRGAVIFGQHSAFPWVWGDYGDPEYGKLSSHHSSKGSEAGSSFADSGISLERSKSTLSRESSTPDLKRRLAELEYENGSVMANSFTSMSGSHEHSLRDPMNYTVGILCALPKESLAVRALFDKCNGKPDLSFGDSNHYSLGQIGKHMVVVACLPEGEYGTNPAAESASNMKRSFPAIQFCLLIGIGGGAPSEQNDIRLGDVVVSKPTKTFPGVIQYDRGKANENNDFQLTGALQRPPRFLMTAVSSLSSDPNLPSDPLEPYLQEIIHRVPGSKKLRYQHPGQEYDELFDEVCSKCQIQEHCINRERHIRRRAPRPNKSPEIHYGLIASGNLVIKDAQVRDQWVKKFGVMCFEMEAAGVMNTFPCLVIRGICDYSDSYKNERWQEYAAATAAAYGKLLLNEVSPFSLSYSPSSELKHRTLEYLGFEENMSKRRRL